MKKIIYLILIAIAFVSCERNEGKGGTSTIKGKVIVREYNSDFTIKLGEYPGQEVDVYIIYGSQDVYGDRFRTDWEGNYEFNYLQEGTYTIYALSKDSMNYITDERIPVFQEVQVSGKNQTVEVPDILIVD